MVGFKILSIFIIVLMLDGLILPAFLGWRESFLSPLVLIVSIFYMDSIIQFVAYGLIFTFVSELLRGLNFGDLVLPFLLMTVIVFVTQRFLDIKYTYDAKFSLSRLFFMVLMLVMFIYIFSFFFKRGGININYFSPVIGLTIISEALMLIFVFNSVFNKKSDYL